MQQGTLVDARREKIGKFGARKGLAEQEALYGITAPFAQVVELVRGLDSLRHYPEPQDTTQAEHGIDDHGAV